MGTDPRFHVPKAVWITVLTRFGDWWDTTTTYIIVETSEAAAKREISHDFASERRCTMQHSIEFLHDSPISILHMLIT
jgi:hypothetical protein